jgi:hypothetical protein
MLFETMPSTANLQACVKTRSLADDMIAVMQRRGVGRRQTGEARLALDERRRAQILAVEVEQIEEIESERGSSPSIRGGPDEC